MPSLFRQTITRHILDGRRVPAGTPGAVKTTTRSKKWYGEIPDPQGGRPLRVPLSTNRAASITMLAQLIRDQGDPTAAHRRTPLADHLDAWHAEIAQAPKGKGGRAPGQAGLADRVGRIRRVLLDVCGYTHAHQIDHAGVVAALASLASPAPPVLDQDEYTEAETVSLLGTSQDVVYRLTSRWRLSRSGRKRSRIYPRSTVAALLARQRRYRGWGGRTVHDAAQHLRRFTAWLVRRRRLHTDPLLELRAGSTEGDHRHDRRPLTAGQLIRLLTATRNSARATHGLAPEDRYHLYLTAASTGFRRSELSSLTPALCNLDADPPVIQLPQRADKAGRKVVQPVPRAVADQLRRYLAGRPADIPIWPPQTLTDAAEQLQADLESAGIPYAIQGPDGPLFADLHAMRHTYIAGLDRAGVSLKVAMQLARHSDPRLTARVYGRADLAELAAAADRHRMTQMAANALARALAAAPDGRTNCYRLLQIDTD